MTYINRGAAYAQQLAKKALVGAAQPIPRMASKVGKMMSSGELKDKLLRDKPKKPINFNK